MHWFLIFVKFAKVKVAGISGQFRVAANDSWHVVQNKITRGWGTGSLPTLIILKRDDNERAFCFFY